MARSKFIRLLTKLTGSIGANELVTRELAFEDSTDSIVFRKPNGALVRINNSSSISQQPYQPSPTLTSLRDALVLSGVMATQPTYSVTGAISGSGTSGVALQLVGAATYNTTSDGSGNFSFTGIPNGTYTLTPTLAGFTYSPSNINVVVNNANLTGQNFTGSAFAGSPETTTTHFFVSNTASAFRAVRKSDGVTESATFSQVNNRATRFCVHNGRIFVPVAANNAVYVYDATTFALTATMLAGGTLQILSPSAVVSNGSKLCVINSSEVQFFTYNNGTNTPTTSGTVQSYTNVIRDITSDGINIYLAHGNTPSLYNLTRINWGTQAANNYNFAIGAGQIDLLCAGNSRLLISTASLYALYDKSTMTQIGSNASIGASQNQGRISYAQGKFYLSTSPNIRIVNESSGAVSSLPATTPALNDSNGTITDGSFVYIADTTLGRSYVINATTDAQSGSSIVVTGLSANAYLAR